MDFSPCMKLLLVCSITYFVRANYEPESKLQNSDRVKYLVNSQFHSHELENIPDSIDWREKGYVTPVQNQGQCQSSSIFSALGALEGQMMKKTGLIVQLSGQQLMECCGESPVPDCCTGQLDPASFFQCIQKIGGIDDAKCYPYDGKCIQCRFNQSCVALKCKGVVTLPMADETSLKIAVATIGPISVTVDASTTEFELYSNGVFDDPSCSSSILNHAMLIVGYGTNNGQKYWIVKNSWGVEWGMNGYIYMSREKNNQCGIATAATYPIV